jgi:hypothetical protein
MSFQLDSVSMSFNSSFSNQFSNTQVKKIDSLLEKMKTKFFIDFETKLIDQFPTRYWPQIDIIPALSQVNPNSASFDASFYYNLFILPIINLCEFIDLHF